MQCKEEGTKSKSKRRERWVPLSLMLVMITFYILARTIYPASNIAPEEVIYPIVEFNDKGEK